jgi:hypothetical protein
MNSFLETSMTSNNTVLVRFYQGDDLFMGAEIHYLGVWLVRTFEGKRNGPMTLRFPVGFHEIHTIKEILVLLRASFQGKNLTKWYVELNGAYQRGLDELNIKPAIEGAEEDGEDKKGFYTTGQNHLVSYLTFMIRRWRTKGQEAEDLAMTYVKIREDARKKFSELSAKDIQAGRQKAACVDQMNHSTLERFMSVPVQLPTKV